MEHAGDQTWMHLIGSWRTRDSSTEAQEKLKNKQTKKNYLISKVKS